MLWKVEFNSSRCFQCSRWTRCQHERAGRVWKFRVRMLRCQHREANGQAEGVQTWVRRINLFYFLMLPAVQLNEGLRRECGDTFSLVYVPISGALLLEESEDEELDGVKDPELINTELTNGKHNSLTEIKPREPTSPISPWPPPSWLPPLKIEWPSLPLLQPQAPQQPLVWLPTLQTQPALLAAYHHILTAKYNGPLKVQSQQVNKLIDITPPWRYVQVIFFNCI